MITEAIKTDAVAVLNNPVALAELFETILSDDAHPLHESLWRELESRGFDIEQTLRGSLVRRDQKERCTNLDGSNRDCVDQMRAPADWCDGCKRSEGRDVTP